jgi:hypothetical protein
MATRANGERTLPPALKRSGARRSTSQKVRFLAAIDDNCDLNALALIQKAKASATFGNINWDASEWNLSAYQTQRSHKQREPKLIFTAHLRGHGMGSRTGEPFHNESRFADLVKATIRLRAEIGGQGVNNQQELIIAFRYVYDELLGMGTTDLKELKREHLDAAVKQVKKRETEVSAYKRIQRLEEIGRLLDENGLIRVKLGWRCSSKKRPESMGHGLLEDEESDGSIKDSKLPTDGIIEAVAYLYHHIPKSEWVDRVRICLISLLVITGFRIGELLTLPARRVQTEDGTGRRFLVYYPEKGAPPQEKWLMTAGGALAEAMIDELLELTAAPRAMAKWLHDHPGSVCIDGLDLTKSRIQVSKIAEALEFAGGFSGAVQFLNARKIAIAGDGEDATVLREEFVKSLRAESYEKPINTVKNTGQKILLKDALACAFGNAFHANRATLKYAARPISEQQLSDFIRARAGQPAAFAKYGVEGPDGKPLKVASHAFRHWLNDLLDRGGLSDVEQAVYFGRLNPKDNRAYQHMTPGERVRKAREDLKGGNLLGPVATLVRRLPADRQDIVLAARVQAVHVVPGGACFHQFSQTPCPNQMACKDGCGDFHWQTDDPIEERELTYEKSVLEIAVETARREVEEESWGADSWLQHNLRKLDQVNASLSDCGAVPGEAKNG